VQVKWLGSGAQVELAQVELAAQFEAWRGEIAGLRSVE
jgi:hypothetical protein